MPAMEGPDASAPVELPEVPEPGDALRWLVNEVTIVEARLGGALSYQLGGSVLLLPTYELISEDGEIWTVVAVDEAHLDVRPDQGSGQPGATVRSEA